MRHCARVNRWYDTLPEPWRLGVLCAYVGGALACIQSPWPILYGSGGILFVLIGVIAVSRLPGPWFRKG